MSLLAGVREPTRSHLRTYEAQGQIRLPDGTVLVQGSGVYIRIHGEIIEQTNSEPDFWQVAPDWSDDIALLPSHAM